VLLHFFINQKMKSVNKTGSEKKQLRKLQQKEKTTERSNKDLKKNQKVDTDFHHEHPFREQ